MQQMQSSNPNLVLEVTPTRGNIELQFCVLLHIIIKCFSKPEGRTYIDDVTKHELRKMIWP
jgi:hypothetical protein